MEQGVVEIEAMTYIRGRSISNAFMIVDEAQNLTTHELKTILTRVGENTKIILIRYSLHHLILMWRSIVMRIHRVTKGTPRLIVGIKTSYIRQSVN